MEPIFCINPYSMRFSAHSIEEYDSCLDKIFMSIVKIGKLARQNSKSVCIYSDADSEDTYSLKEYRVNLEVRNRDLSYYVKQIQQRSPYYDYVNDSEFEDIVKQKILIYGQEYADATIFYFAAKSEGVLMSVPLERVWSKEIIDFSANGVSFSVWNLFDNDKSRIEKLVLELFKYKTLLDNPTRFESIGKVYAPSKQKIYREKATGYYWYFDYQHKDNKKHFEVFDSTGKRHLGEADMNGIINKRSAKRGRTIEQYL